MWLALIHLLNIDLKEDIFLCININCLIGESLCLLCVRLGLYNVLCLLCVRLG